MKRFLVALAILAVPVAVQGQEPRATIRQDRSVVVAPAPTSVSGAVPALDANLLNQAQAQGGLSAAVLNLLQRLTQLQQQAMQNAKQARSAQQAAAHHLLLQQAEKIREAANAALVSNVVVGQMKMAGAGISAGTSAGVPKTVNPNAQTWGHSGTITSGTSAFGQTPAGVVGTAQQVYAVKIAEAEAAKQQNATASDAFIAQHQAMLADIMRTLQEIMAAQNEAMKSISRM